jgi:lipid-binding SYLF domain-containing protein
MRNILGGLALLLACQVPLSAQKLDEKISDRLYESSKVLGELLNAPDGDAPKYVLERAECVAIIPAVKKAAFGFGGQYGRGVVSCKKDKGKGPWGPPSMFGLSGGSFGLQLGGQSYDVVMMFMTPDSVEHLLKDKLTLGGDMAAAAGPKGRAVSAETTASMRSEILTYARSRGLYAGISFTGAVLSPDKDANKSLYGKEIPAKDLLLTGEVAVPGPAQKLIDALTAAGATAGATGGTTGGTTGK